MSAKEGEADFIQDDDGKLRRVHAWIDARGRDCAREDAVGAIGKDDNGSWWSVAFNGRPLVKVETH